MNPRAALEMIAFLGGWDSPADLVAEYVKLAKVRLEEARRRNWLGLQGYVELARLLDAVESDRDSA